MDDPDILTDAGFEYYRLKHHLTSSQMQPIIDAVLSSASIEVVWKDTAHFNPDGSKKHGT